MITFTPDAQIEISRLCRCRGLQKPLRLEVVAGGCFNYYYRFSFDQQRPKDVKFEIDSEVLIISPETAEKIRDLQIDYASDLMGGGFRFTNALAANICSCGLSFELLDL
ncbi:MAG: iron-sulfur cluster assembly accessory protein [Cyanobacteria bacterium P01_H01_bin.15]